MINCQNTNNDADKRLFRSMIAMIEFMDDRTIDKQFYFGTDKFENVWEKLIDKFFGVLNKQDYFLEGNGLKDMVQVKVAL